MKWKEFVEEVERQLKEENISRDSEIFFIDCSGWGIDDNEIFVGKDGDMLTISA